MNSYTTDDLLVLAKRHHNTKRSYLLVNPLQAKHLPADPDSSLEMMAALGRRLAEAYPYAKLVIGFAETATAIGAAVAACMGEGCKYIHTTREACPEGAGLISFNEEHSHAVEQTLVADHLAEWIAQTEQIIFVDDEISTGKTLLNVIAQLRAAFPEAENKEIVAASVISRLSPQNEERFAQAGVKSECLLKLDNEDLTERVASFDISEAMPPCAGAKSASAEIMHVRQPLRNPRLGVDARDYAASCRLQAEELIGRLPAGKHVLVLGTEECMYPALVLAQCLRGSDVVCHATTRSPIGLCTDPAYPIRSGFRLHSFYDGERTTYIYNLRSYDLAIVYTDTPNDDARARADIAAALGESGCPKVIFIEGGQYVQQL